MSYNRILLLLSLAAIPYTRSLDSITISDDCVRGAVIGAALGDALGRVTEFIDTTQKIKEKYGPLGVTSLKALRKMIGF